VVNARLPVDGQIDPTVFWKDHTTHFQKSRKLQHQLNPIAGADEVVQQLARRYVLWLVTARAQNSMSIILEVLDNLFPTAFTGVHCVWHHHNNGRIIERPKHEYMAKCAPKHRVAFIDDHPMEIRRASSVVRSYLFDPNHWLTNETDIEHRVHSWEEIGALLL
jgi:5'(3')-deoxyribonucleotidase